MAKNEAFATPLHLACPKGHLQVARYFIQSCRIDLDKRDVYKYEEVIDSQVTRLPTTLGERLLYLASLNGHLDILK